MGEVEIEWILPMLDNIEENLEHSHIKISKKIYYWYITSDFYFHLQ